MNQPTKRSDSGFTIIEVVLVLAIGALIMLMVFIALPALQRGQRDTQRKDDVSRLQSSINSYKSANRGSVPSDWPAFVNSHMKRAGDSFTDPSGSDYTIVDATAAASSGTLGFSYALGTSDNVDAMYKQTGIGGDASKIYVVRGGSCNFTASQIQGAAASARKVAILKALEDGNYECRES